MSENEAHSQKQKAIEVLQHLPETATVREILLAIHEQSQIDNNLALAQEMRQLSSSQVKGNRISDVMGCLFPIAGILVIILLMPILFSLGERLVSKPPPEIEKGQIVTLELVNASDATPYIGKACRVLTNHLEIETAEGKTLIPNEQYRKVVLQSGR